MKIIVFIKQVPDTNEVKIDQKTGTLIRAGVPSIINPDDKNAIEAAVRLKEANKDCTITLVTMGPPQAEVALREALAMGCDDAILITDRVFAGSDTWATSLILTKAAQKIGDYDLIIAGRQAIDGDTAQVGPQIAEKLGIPQVTYVEKLEIKDGKALVHRWLEDGYQVIEAKMPCLITAIGELNTPRYPSFPGIFEAYKKEITVWSNEDLKVDPVNSGLDGSPTKVHKTFTPTMGREGVTFSPAGKAEVVELVALITEKNII